jgi:curved DNA-binding protein CbpA
MLARAYHPDTGNADDDGAFKRIAEAYAVLSDPRRRTIYDAQLIARERETGQDSSHVSV